MSPETQATETHFSIENDMGYEYEPLPEQDAEALYAPSDHELPEPLDPITADLLNFKGGNAEDWKLEGEGGGYTFDGAQVRDSKTGEAWSGFSEYTIDQLRTSDMVRLDDVEADGKIIVTYLIKGSDNSISYQMHATDLPTQDDERDYVTFSDATLNVERHVAWYDTAVETEASVEQSDQLLAEYVAAEVAQPGAVEGIGHISAASPERHETAAELTEQYAVERDQEHASVLSELLMERLPAFDVEQEEVVLLRGSASVSRAEVVAVGAPEEITHPVIGQMPQTQERIAVPHVETIERFPEGAIIQISRPREVAVPQKFEAAPIVVAERAAEQPAVPEQRAVEKRDEPKVETRLETKKGIRFEPEHKAETPPEKFRIRRGRERFVSEHRAPVSHHESEEVVISTPRSVAETAVIKMLERYAPEIKDTVPEEAEEQKRETPIVQLETKTVRDTLTLAPEHAPLERETEAIRARSGELQEDNVASLETARNERVVRTEIDEVLAAHGLSRTSRVEVAQVAPQEGLLSPLGRRPQLSDAANDNQQDDFVTSRNGIIMRRVA